MATPPIEQDLIFDADGRQVMSMVDLIAQKLQRIQQEVTAIVNTANKGGKDFDTTLNLTTKRLTQTLGQLNKLTTGTQQAAPGITALNANQGLARQTRQATEYARELNTARNAAEALTAKIAKLNQQVAERGRAGGFATTAQTDQLKRLEQASAALRRLDQQYDALEAKARRTRGVDLSPQISAVGAARDKLFAAASDGRRTNLTAELNGLTDAQAQLAERITRARVEEAAALRASRQARKELAVADAASAKTSAELDRERAASAARIRDLRNQLKTASDQERVGLLSSLEVEKARGRQLAANAREVDAMARAEQSLGRQANKQLIPAQMRADAQTYGATTVSTGAQLERELALKQLSAAATDKERIAALRNVEVANMRVAAAQKLVAEEEKEIKLLNAETEALRRAELLRTRSTVNRSVRGEIDSVGITQAQINAKQRVLDLENRIVTATAREQRELADQLAIEQKKLTLIERTAAARDREVAATARQTAASERNSIGARVGRAAFNTALYGGVAAVGYGLLNTAQQGVSNALEIEDEFAKLQAIAGATSGQMNVLKDSIFDVANTTRFATDDIIKISQTLAQAGVSARDMEDVLKSVTTLATASGSTPDEAVNLVTSALGSFQLQGTEAARVADLMTTALNRTKLTVAQTGQAIQYVGATAYEQNISLEGLLATIGAVAQAGIRSGSTIGTGFRQFLVDLQNPSEKLTDQLTLLGLKSEDVNVSVRGLPAVLETLKTAGFGAGQAYAALETRAAAFYLVAKNNTSVMTDLQIGFAQSGAAALANERAMNSLGAQWQRFKNILSEGFSEDLETTFIVLKDLLTNISDRMAEMKEVEKKLATDRSLGNQIAARGGGITGTIMGLDAYAEEKSIEALRTLQTSVLNLLDGNSYISGKGMGTRWDEYIDGVNRAATSTKDLETRVAETSEEVAKSADTLNAVEKEYGRLVLQQDSYKNNTQATQAETATMAARFDGLAKFLTNATDRYSDLTQALRAFRNEQLQLSNTNLTGQIGAMTAQTVDAQQQQLKAIAGARRAPGFSGLTADQQQAFNAPNSVQNQAKIAAIATQARKDGNLDLAKYAGQIAQQTGVIANNTAQTRAAISTIATQANDRTQVGQRIFNDRTQAEQNIKKIETMAPGADRDKLATQTNQLLQNLDRLIVRTYNQTQPGNSSRQYLRDQRETLKPLTTQLQAATAQTKDQKKAEEKSARQAAAAERKATAEANRATREANAGPLATQADVDAVGAVLGLKPGSGQRTAAEQNHLHAIGATPATAATSGHSRLGGAARDFPTGDVSQAQGEALAAAARKYFADQGIPVFVKYENGRGRGQGTGKHVHVNLLPGARKSLKGQNDQQQAAFDAQDDINRAGTAIDKRRFNVAVKDIRDGTSQAVIDDTGALLTKLGDELKRDAIAELAKRGIANPDDPRFQERMAQVGDEIQSLTDQYNTAVTEGLVRNLEAQVKAATDAFNAAIAPAEQALAVAQASAAGLDNYSLQNKVPDYVRVIAQQRVNKASEDVQRARLDALPAKIADTEAAAVKAEQLRDSMPRDASGYATAAAEADKLRAAVTALNTEQQALNATLNAGQQLPKTFAEGLRMALEAYKTANPEQDFKNTFLMRIGSDITSWADELNGGIARMMEDIMKDPMAALRDVGDWFGEFFSDTNKGLNTMIQGFGRMAQAVIGYLAQIAAKAAASQLINWLMGLATSFLGSTFGPKVTPTGAAAGTSQGFIGPPSFNGGPAMEGLMGGGRITNGSDTRDSVTKRLAKGEWVVRKKAVDSVGNDFMANLNRHGAKAVASMGSTPVLPPPAKQETSVYVVAPEQKPTMGPNDVLVAIQSDILSGGETKKLIKYVAQGG